MPYLELSRGAVIVKGQCHAGHKGEFPDVPRGIYQAWEERLMLLKADLKFEGQILGLEEQIQGLGGRL